MHYWLRPIRGVHFRFANFASHFVRVQTPQLDFISMKKISPTKQIENLINFLFQIIVIIPMSIILKDLSHKLFLVGFLIH